VWASGRPLIPDYSRPVGQQEEARLLSPPLPKALTSSKNQSSEAGLLIRGVLP
jgi:hypothetical protein